jgi:hypothetical protein
MFAQALENFWVCTVDMYCRFVNCHIYNYMSIVVLNINKVSQCSVINYILVCTIYEHLGTYKVIFYCTGRFWCFTRMTYMPIAFLYGKKFVGPITPTILALRDELYDLPYDKIDWNQARNTCARVCQYPLYI